MVIDPYNYKKVHHSTIIQVKLLKSVVVRWRGRTGGAIDLLIATVISSSSSSSSSSQFTCGQAGREGSQWSHIIYNYCSTCMQACPKCLTPELRSPH